jgi:hypothetical protein
MKGVRNLYRTIEHAERATFRDSQPQPTAPVLPKRKRSQITSWRAEPSRPQHSGEVQINRREVLMTSIGVIVKALKITASIDPAELAALPDQPKDASRVKLAVTCDGVAWTAEVAGKSFRKALGVIREHGADSIFCSLQGKLKGREIVDCGLTAGPKIKPQEAQK